MLRAISILLFIIIFPFLHASAQDTTGTISGCVADSSDKPCVGANVVVLGTSPLRGAVAKPDGSYVVRGVRPGEYQIEVRSAGFERKRKTGVFVCSGEATDAGFILSPIQNIPYSFGARRYPYALIRSTGTEHIIASFDLDPSELVNVVRDR